MLMDSAQAATFRKERRIADVDLVFLWQFGLGLAADGDRNASQAKRVA
jgi:hypothetical protein